MNNNFSDRERKIAEMADHIRAQIETPVPSGPSLQYRAVLLNRVREGVAAAQSLASVMTSRAAPAMETVKLAAHHHALPILRKVWAGSRPLLVPAAIGFLCIGTLIGFVLLVRFDAVKLELANLKRELDLTRDRLAQAERSIGDRASSPVQAPSGRSTLPTVATSSPGAALKLTTVESQMIREFIRVPPPPPGAEPRFQVGDKPPDATLSPMPDPVVVKIPKLRDARFTVDRDGSIVIVGPGSSAVDFVVPLG